MTKRIEDTMELLDRLTSRMTFAESQLKVLQDKGVTHSKGTCIFQVYCMYMYKYIYL